MIIMKIEFMVSLLKEIQTFDLEYCGVSFFPQGDSWMETWHEGWGFKSAHKEARDSSGSHRVERWGEQFFDDGSGEKWAQHWQEGPPGSAGGPRRSSGKSWGDRWGAGGVGGHRWGEEWGPDGCRKWAHDTPGRPEGC
ncbi:hypothetical protein Emag_004980 [Eimeria magna]